MEFYESPDTKWKVDILISNPAVVNRILAQGKVILEKLNDENRKSILEVKSELTKYPDFKLEFTSTDIYIAVINDKVSNMREWIRWRNKQIRKKKASSKKKLQS